MKQELIQLIEDLMNAPEITKAKMIRVVASEIIKELNEKFSGRIPMSEHELDSCEFGYDTINYSHYCDLLGWPDFQDSGIFEQCIQSGIYLACVEYCLVNGYRATAMTSKFRWAIDIA